MKEVEMNYAKARVSPKRSVALVVYQVLFFLALGYFTNWAMKKTLVDWVIYIGDYTTQL